MDIAELKTVWSTLGIEPTALVADSKGTIVPDAMTQAPPPSLGYLPHLSLAGESAAPELKLGPTLGEGGMGVVRLATQLPLGREVAVKTGRREASLALLREARITGTLEHPNVVPVHALGRDTDGAPLLVMKKIDGTSWRELIKDPDRSLDFHLDVLMQVCNAVHFAHSKGILHRDIKPDNVMIGPFGEVYLLDWGIAVSTREEDVDLLPLAREVREIAGTPQYMAPEMAAADGARIDERTDVYLLGAVLHECLTGEPRHLASSILQLLELSCASAPVSYGDDVPTELAAICNRATSVDPTQRFASAEELRQAIALFLRHRASAALAETATARLASLRELVAGPTPVPEEHEQQIHVRFSECRFGFQEALKTWPDNPEARDGLRQAIELMLAHQIAEGDLGAATALLRELDAPPPELAGRLAELERRTGEERANLERLEALERDMDINVGRRTRAFLITVLAVVYTLVPFLGAIAERRGWFVLTHATLLLDCSLFGLAWAGAALWARETLFKTAINRQFVYAMGAFCVTLLSLAVGGWLLGIAPRLVVTLILPNLFLLIAVLAATVDRRLFLAALLYLAGFFVAAALPAWGYAAFGVANLLALAHVAYIWKPECRSKEQRAAT